jgi:hypothetical protein
MLANVKKTCLSSKQNYIPNISSLIGKISIDSFNDKVS